MCLDTYLYDTLTVRLHDIIQIHDSVLWDGQYFLEYFPYSY